MYRPLLAALCLTLCACLVEPEPLPPPPVPEDVGDFEDTGPYAACRFNAGECGMLDTLAVEPSACDSFSLGMFNPEGIYTMHVRSAPSAQGPHNYRTTALRLVTNGGMEVLAGGPLTERVVDPDRIFLASQFELADGGTRRRAFLGCRMPVPGELRGCYAECRNGQLAAQGSFRAVRVGRMAGEPEASGLRRVAEAAAPQGTPVDVYVTQGHAYVVALGGGLAVYDVRDAARPVLTRHVYLPTDNAWNGVWASGDVLYVASASRGVLVFDLTRPGEPELLRTVPSGTLNVHTLFVHGTLLYGSSAHPDGVVLIFDIRDPRNPVLLSQFKAQGFDSQRAYGPHDMFAFEDRLYVNYWGAGYVVADVSDPARPRELGRYRYARSTSHASAVARFGERLIAFEGGEDWGAHLRVLDVTDPAAVRRVADWRLREHISIHNLVLVGTRLYVAHYQDGVRVLDVSVPENPRPVAHFNTFRASDPSRGISFYDGAIGIRVPGDGYVYTVDSSRGLLILQEE